MTKCTSSCICSTRVSNELGAGRPRAALLAARVVILLAFLVGTSEGLLLILVRHLWGHAYSKDQEVVASVAKMMLILAPSVLFDGLQYVLSGTYTHQRKCIDSINSSKQFRL
jgi:MATE family multidrug resistance protein